MPAFFSISYSFYRFICGKLYFQDKIHDFYDIMV